MTPSVAKEIGKESGIIQGVTLYFKTFKGLQEHINDKRSQDDPSGTYIISSGSGSHATIGMGVHIPALAGACVKLPLIYYLTMVCQGKIH